MTNHPTPLFFVERDEADGSWWLYAENAGFDEDRRARLTDIEISSFSHLDWHSEEAQALLAEIWKKRSVEWFKQEQRDLSGLTFGRKIMWAVQPDIEGQYQGHE